MTAVQSVVTFRRRRRLDGTVPLAESQVDAHRFSDVYVAYIDRLVIYFARRTISADLGVELAAETLARAFEQRQRFQGASPHEEEAWIFAIARTQLHRYWRHEKVQRKALERLGMELTAFAPDELAEVEDRAQLVDIRKRLGDGIDQLTALQRAAVQLRVVEERGYGEIAAELGVNEQAARAHVSRGLRALAKLEDPRTEVA